MTTRCFFWFALPLTIIAFFLTLVVTFTPRWMEYKPVPAVNATVNHYKIGVFENCTRSAKLLRYTNETHQLSKMKNKRNGGDVRIIMKIKRPVWEYGGWDCEVIGSEVYSDELFFLFVVGVSLGFFVLLFASIAAIVKFFVDWIPNEKIEESKPMFSRSLGMGLIAATLVGSIVLCFAVLLFLIWWSATWSQRGWITGRNRSWAWTAAGVAGAAAILWFIDVRKMAQIEGDAYEELEGETEG